MQNLNTAVEEIDETRWSWRTNIISWPRVLCTQRDCKSNESIVDEYRKMFESGISAGATEKLPGWQKPHAQTVAWSYDMEGHAEKCVERYCELANKKVDQLHKVSHPCLDDHQFKQEELESVGELSEVCSQIVLPTRTRSLAVMIWKDMRRHAWNDTANWRIERLSNCLRTVRHVLMTINSKRKKWKRWRIVKSLLSNCLTMPVFGTHW